MFNNKERDNMYKVIRWSDDGTEHVWEAPQKPTFQQMYKLINCTTIERQSGYDKDISNRTFDMWCDEAWYKDYTYGYPNNTNHCFKNDLLGQRILITEAQYNNSDINNPNQIQK